MGIYSKIGKIQSHFMEIPALKFEHSHLSSKISMDIDQQPLSSVQGSVQNHTKQLMIYSSFYCEKEVKL